MSETSDISKAQIVLASQSPRRRAYMQQLGVDFYVLPSDIPEPLPQHIPPEQNAINLATAKAQAVIARIRNENLTDHGLVVGSDSIVATAAGIQLAKAEDEQEARDMLNNLFGTVSLVITGVALIDIATNEVRPLLTPQKFTSMQLMIRASATLSRPTSPPKTGSTKLARMAYKAALRH